MSTDRIQHVKSQLPQNGLDSTQDVDEAAGEDYSPMPSEEPSEPFEVRRSSVGKSENLSRPENPAKATDSEPEVPKAKQKKAKKKKGGKKNDSTGVRQSHDDESLKGVGD